MEDFGLLEALGIAGAYNEFMGGEPSFYSDPMDPGGYMRAQGLDPYGNPLPTGGPILGADGQPIKPKAGPVRETINNAASKVRSATAGPRGKLGAFASGIDSRLTPVANAQTAALAKGVRGTSKLMGFSPSAAGNAGRMAMQAMRSPVGRSIVKFAPVVGGAMAVGDLVMGDESLGNKAMDATAMTIGGILGSGIPVVGTALGASAGKMISDGAQFILGGGKSPEERRMEEALAQLQGRGMY